MKISARHVRTGIGLVLLAVLIWYLDIRTVFAPFRSISLQWTLATAALIVFATLISAFSLHLFINQERRIPFGSFLPLYWVSWAIGLVVPGQVGDIASISASLRRHGFAWQVSLGRSVLDKGITLLAMLFFALMGLAFAADVRWNAWSLFFALALALVSLLAAYLARHRLVAWFPSDGTGWRGSVRKTADEFMTTLKRRPSRVAVNFIFSVVKILVAGASYLTMFVAFGFDGDNYFKVVCFVAVSSLVAYLPVSFNGIGTAEAAGIAMFSTLGMAPSTVLSAYIALRLLVLVLAWTPASLWLFFAPQEKAG